jgi:hypothetical protein
LDFWYKNLATLFQSKGEPTFYESVVEFGKVRWPEMCFVIVDAVDEILASDRSVIEDKLLPSNVCCVISCLAGQPFYQLPR